MTRARDLARFVNNQALSIDGDLEVGINSSTPAARLDVRGNTIITGILTATTFSGALSGNATGLSGTPDITVNNIVAAGATFSGVLTYEDVTNVDSVGIITARSDVSIADKIIHTGDTDTAVRFPADNTFTVETGGSEALRVDSSQRLILGATSAVDGGSTSLIQAASTGGARIILARNDTTTAQNDSLGRIRFYGNDSDGNYDECARLEVIADADHTSTSKASAITVHTTASGAESPTERLRITSTGEVRVGSAFSVGQAGVCTASSFTDSIGDVRSIPLKTESSSASYTLIASDAGKTIHVHSTTTTVVVPNSVFSAGDAVSIVNGDGSNTPTISQGTGFSLRNTGDGSTGNRTLGVFGMATIYFTGAGVGYISGSGMT